MKVSKKLKYFVQMFQILWCTDRKFLFAILLDVILAAIQPFPLIFLARESVNILTDSARTYNDLVRTVGGLLIADFVISIVDNHIQYITAVKGNLIGNKLNEKIFQKCIEMDYELLARKDIQEKRRMAKKIIEGGSFNNLTLNFRILVANMLTLFGIALTIATTDILILVVTAGIIGINTVAVYKRKKTEYQASREVIPVNRKIEYYETVTSDFSYMKEIKIFHMGKALIERQGELLKEISSFLKKIFTGWRVTNGVNISTNSILQVLLYFLLGFKLMVQKIISIGDFTLYITAITQFKNAMTSVSNAFVDIDNNGQYIKDYFEFLNLPCRFDKGKIRISEIVSDDFVFEFENVSFIYPFTEKYALKNISCRIYKGERISIVGENGSGKTTFIKLLLRLYDPTEGIIKVNGVDIREIDYSDYLGFFSAAFQDFNVFAYTIRENVNSLQDIDDAEIISAIQRIGLQKKINGLEKGLDTYLYQIYDENGIELSGGEAQRLAIARAICKNSKIVLLDEPTAAIDPRVEAEIFRDFDKIVQNTTSISISHRMASSKSASKIMVFQYSELIEVGTHCELMKANGVYAELYNLQAQMYTEDL